VDEAPELGRRKRTLALTIDFSPLEEAQIAVAARQEGLETAALVKKLVHQHLPSGLPVSRVQTLLTQWQAQDNTPHLPSVPAHSGETPTQAQFRQWAVEDAGMTEKERQEEDELWEEFERGINQTRDALGMRRLSP